MYFIPEQLENRYERDEYFFPYRYRQSLRVTEGIWTLKETKRRHKVQSLLAVARIGRQFYPDDIPREAP